MNAATTVEAVHPIYIDRGGTFTDCIGVDPRDGSLRVVKVLSSDRAPLDGIRALLGLAPTDTIPMCDIRMGTTAATNALLEGTGARTALVVTEGFGDLLEIGDQTRPELFALRIDKPKPLVAATLEISARMAADGSVLLRPDTDATRQALRELREQGIESLAVVLLHGHRNGELEREIGSIAREVGFQHVVLSHEVAAQLGLLARAGTAVIDAYLTPVLHAYMRVLLVELAGSRFRVMQSSGGLIDARHFRGKNALVSGPAGGVVACGHIARELGLPEVLGIDMGGTSTDVSRYAGELPRNYETRVAGLLVHAPTIEVHTVAAGGGSICRYDATRFQVGPQSAGANPGPLCYGHPGASEVTLTDVALALGRLTGERFPFPLDRRRVDAALASIAGLLAARGDLRGPQGVAAGFLELAVEHMAEAIRKVSVAKGHDVREHALIVFGGAGGQFACPVARVLGIRKLIFHPLASVLSAFGMGVADVEWHGEVDAGRVAIDAAAMRSVHVSCAELEARGRAVLAAEGHASESLRVEQRIDLRYRGTEAPLTLALQPTASLVERFAALHLARYGYARDGHVVEALTVRVAVISSACPPKLPRLCAASAGAARVHHFAPLWTCGHFEHAPCYLREDLVVGENLVGPAIVLEATGTIVVDRGFSASLDANGYVTLLDVEGAARTHVEADHVDPVQMEIFENLFMSIAEQMGLVLARTALSTNIRERLDFSCAIFDAQGELVANAPHIPVHLGAMSESVRAVMAAHPDPEPGDVFATNDPALGGSHLPDITVVTPVFDEQRKLTFFTASRGHHADIGGVTPGSMPPFSRTLEQEGAVFRALRIARGAVLDEALIRSVLGRQRYPARDIDQNLADLEAQIAANCCGAKLLWEAAERYGKETLGAYMRFTLADAETRVQEAIRKLGDGVYAFSDAMDDGSPIVVTLTITGSRMKVDFTGSAPAVQSNLNAPRAVTIAAVLYVLRVLVDAPIPLNSGCLRPIELVIPEGSILAPGPDAAVVAGNVETSQRLVDVLLGALGKLAASQGTMNNLTFGDASFGYYETIAGGAGAGAGFAGASGVHTHMTNTRITDAEVLESRFPVRVWRFSLRKGSGGRGRFAGGDGVVRELEALAPLEFSILSSRRTLSPFGLAGGAPGRAGANFHADRLVPGSTTFHAVPGERIRIETPGGGGFGPPDEL